MLNYVIFCRKVRGLHLSVSEIPDESVNQILVSFINLLTSSPYLLVPFILSFISGHMWSYIILSHFTKKERKILCSKVSRISLGLLWLALVLIFTYAITYRTFEVNIDNLKNIIFTALIISFALQAIILAIITICKKG